MGKETKMVYVFKARLCTWVICPNASCDTPWDLRWYVGDEWEKSGAYILPVIASDDVAHQATGYSTWDTLPFDRIPSKIEDIGEWQKLKQYP